jgi:hypothetical protein
MIQKRWRSVLSHGYLLPDSGYYEEQRALYDSNPTKYELKTVYLGAIFAIENFEQGTGAVVPVTSAQARSRAVIIGRVQPKASGQGSRKNDILGVR